MPGPVEPIPAPFLDASSIYVPVGAYCPISHRFAVPSEGVSPRHGFAITKPPLQGENGSEPTRY